MSEGAPAGDGPTIIAAAPSPKIMREERTVPILLEKFSAQTSRTGRSISCKRRTASASPYDMPAQAEMMSQEQWVWASPNSPDNQADTEGISRVLVQLQNSTAPISDGLRPDFVSAARTASRDISSRLNSL